MCFTVNVNLVKEELENRYGATFLDPDKYHPSYYYHAFALPELPAICSGKKDKIQILKWGLIPSWVKNIDSAGEIRFKTFNARSESIDSKPSFSSSFASKRCIIPVKGFFEWQHTGQKKIPWYIYRSDNDIISMAGLWSEWTDTDSGDSISTFSIVTTDANDLMAGIHNSQKRMPVVLERSQESKWLDLTTPKEEALNLLKPYPSEVLKAHTISQLVNRNSAVRNSPDVIKPFNWNSESSLF
jgi:putative SOS response-associated peptidase YedK